MTGVVETKKLHSLDEMLEFAVAIIEKRESYAPVEIVGTSLKIEAKIEGDSWGRLFDARHAKYVLSLQETLDDLLTEQAPDKREAVAPKVKVEIKAGSSDVWADVLEFAKVIVTPMTPEQTFIATVTAILAVSGGFVVWRWLEGRSAVQVLSEHEETKRVAMRALHQNAERTETAYVPYERPVRTMLNMMEDDDSVALGGSESIPRSEARKAAPRQKRTEGQVSYADGEYVVDAIHYTLGQTVLNLSQDGASVKAYVDQLSEEDRVSLSKSITDQEMNDEIPPTLSLQLNVHHTQRMIKHAVIVGVGLPREGKQKCLVEIV